MPRFRKKAVDVEAVQWFPDRVVEGVRHVNPIGNMVLECWYVVNANGYHSYLHPGDWVITEQDGIHHYVCDDSVFKKSYEPIE